MNSSKEKRFISILMRYKPEELPDLLDWVFPGINWNTVRSTAVTLHLNLTKIRELAYAIVHAFQEVRPPLEDVQFAFWHLQFFDAVLHKYLQWYGALLSSKESEFPKDSEELKNRIRHEYTSDARKVEVMMKMESDIVFIMLVEKIITKKGMKHGRPFFAAVNLDGEKKHIFFNPRMDDDNSGTDHLMLLRQALGYGHHRQINFSGYDVKSMFRMIKNQEQNALQVIPQFDPVRYRVEENVTDFTQGRDRMHYAINVLPPGQTNLKEFSVHSRNEFRGIALDIPPSVTIDSQMTIIVKGKEKSVEDVLRELITIGHMELPVPGYVSKFTSLDRNSIKLRTSAPVEATVDEFGTSDEEGLF